MRDSGFAFRSPRSTVSGKRLLKLNSANKEPRGGPGFFLYDCGPLEVRHVGYLVVGGAVQGLLQALLVEDVAEDADGAAYYE